jgi:hypothetical protein
MLILKESFIEDRFGGLIPKLIQYVFSVGSDNDFPLFVKHQNLSIYPFLRLIKSDVFHSPFPSESFPND